MNANESESKILFIALTVNFNQVDLNIYLKSACRLRRIYRNIHCQLVEFEVGANIGLSYNPAWCCK